MLNLITVGETNGIFGWNSLESLKQEFKRYADSFVGAFIRFNTLRGEAGLEPIEKVWHSRHMSETQMASLFGPIDYIDFCSSYMLATRLIYPMFEEPVHNSKIHDMARHLPNGGDSSYLKIAIATKRSCAKSWEHDRFVFSVMKWIQNTHATLWIEAMMFV